MRRLVDWLFWGVVVLIVLAACATVVFHDSEDTKRLDKDQVIGVQEGEEISPDTKMLLQALSELQERLVYLEGILDVGGSDPSAGSTEGPPEDDESPEGPVEQG